MGSVRMGAPADGGALSPVARIGPNAATQLDAALTERLGGAAAAQVFAAAGLGRLRQNPPTAMIPETEAAALHRALRRTLPAELAAAVAAEAGRRTGAYILEHRIPRLAQRLLRAAPPALAEALLLRAIAAHAWTFVGSGALEHRGGRPTRIWLEGNPLVAGERSDRPLCAWHAAVFERLFRALVSPRTVVLERACCAQGASTCLFELDRRGA